MKIVLTVGGLAPEFGGPSQTVPALATALAEDGLDVELIACESLPGQTPPSLPDETLVRSKLLPIRSRQRQWRARNNDFFNALCDRNVDVIHDNGLWLPSNHAVAAAASRFGCPLMISPRGMLSSWAMRHRSWKKKIAWRLFQRRDLATAQVLHATSTQEADDLRKAGLEQPIAVVPNGVEIPPNLQPRERSDDTHVVLCIARIHPIKGLLNLVRAWAEVRPRNWHVIIVGNDEEGHSAEICQALQTHGLTDAFTLTGPLNSESKWSLYRQANLFVLPSYSENFGLAIAEALASELPVITTTGTPWRELIQHQCGWWVEIGAKPLAEALEAAVKLTDAQRHDMGRRGRQLIADKYTWPHVAGQMKSVYAWMSGADPKPDWIL